jgi:hemerythrin-like domain-containing protein
MATTGTSSADALRQAHAELLRDLRKLTHAVRPGSGETVTALIARLATTHADLLAHFRFEEQDGYMDALRKDAPHLEHAIQNLVAEHDQLAQGLDTLIHEARAAQAVDASLGERVREWVRRVRQHEARENALVQETLNLDIGPED